MSALCPRQCIATYGAPASATTASIRGSASPPLTSLTSAAPASTRRRGHLGAHRVDARPRRPSAASAADHRQHPAQLLRRPATRAAPGRVDSPPTSTRSAPSASSARPCATAASASSQRPPSEKESGVTLTTPITSGRSSAGDDAGSPGGPGSAARAGQRRRSPARDDQAHRLGPGGGVAQLAADRRGDGAWRPACGRRASTCTGARPRSRRSRRAARGCRISASATWVVSRSCTCGPLGVDVDQPGQLGQPGDLAVSLGM